MVKRLSAKVGEYQKDGQTKGKYVEIGVVLSSDRGEYVLLDPTVNLAGILSLQNMMNHKAGRKTGDRVMVGVFSDDNSGSRDDGPRGGSSSGGQSQGGGGRNDIDDEIPF